MSTSDAIHCPLPGDLGGERVLLAHGEGGALMRRLLSEHILPRLGCDRIQQEDAAVLSDFRGRPVLSTDAFVVSPLFFPGGDIGCLSVYGTVNDLAVRGAEPLWLTLSLILEEGLSMALLDRVLESAAAAARRCRVAIVAGDTKVVPRGAADRIFISTTGLGRLLEPAPTGATTIQVGDVILVSGSIGRHGVAILAAREEMNFTPPPTSDCGPLLELIAVLRAVGLTPRAMRDATRGGVTAVLHEWSRDCGHTLAVDEVAVPISAEVRGASELLGLDPLSIANEGTMVVVVKADEAAAALAALRSVDAGKETAIIGDVRPRSVMPVVIRRALGREQPLIEPAGAPLPRIC